jgi:hypothetical protein
MSNNLSFKQFLKEEESFFTGMSKIGINKDDYKKFPQYASFFSLGKSLINFGNYSILDYKKNEDGKITHAVVKLINDPHVHSLKFDKDYPSGKENKDSSDETFIVPIEELEQLLGQGQQQASPDSGMGGDMGGMGGL